MTTATQKITHKYCECCRKWFHWDGRNYKRWARRQWCSRECAALNRKPTEAQADPTEEEIRERAKWIRDNLWGKGESGDPVTPVSYEFPERIDWRERE